MAKKKSDIATPKGDSSKGNRRKKSDSSGLLPVAVADQSDKSKSTKVVAKREKLNDELVTNCDQFVTVPQIENMIFTIRNVQVMVDRDLAMLYGEETKVMNQAIKRNVERFPERFRFQLTDEETTELVTNCDRFSSLKHSSSNPFVFTEQGVAMLSAVLRSETAVSVSVQIMDAFVAMRHFIASNAQVFQRLEVIEHHQLEMSSHLTKNDNQIAEIFKRCRNQIHDRRSEYR